MDSIVLDLNITEVAQVAPLLLKGTSISAIVSSSIVLEHRGGSSMEVVTVGVAGPHVQKELLQSQTQEKMWLLTSAWWWSEGILQENDLIVPLSQARYF